MFNTYEFMTTTVYEGSWNKSVQAMDGFGTYYYPDGSVYRGYFKAGLFDGFGSLKLLTPYKFSIRAYFQEGMCKIIHEVHFSDGMRFTCRIDDDGEIQMNTWKYCTSRDRRFYVELLYGIEPFGPHARLTSRREKIKIPKGTYDTAEGFYNPKTGFLTVIETAEEENSLRFIGCPKLRKWIFKYCRFQPRCFRRPVEPSSEFAKEILSCNMNSREHHDVGSCPCRGNIERERYFGDLCRPRWTSDEPDFEEGTNRVLPSQTSSDESFDYKAMANEEDEEEDCTYHTCHRSVKVRGATEEERRLRAQKIKIMKYIN